MVVMRGIFEDKRIIYVTMGSNFGGTWEQAEVQCVYTAPYPLGLPPPHHYTDASNHHSHTISKTSPAMDSFASFALFVYEMDPWEVFAVALFATYFLFINFRNQHREPEPDAREELRLWMSCVACILLAVRSLT